MFPSFEEQLWRLLHRTITGLISESLDEIGAGVGLMQQPLAAELASLETTSREARAKMQADLEKLQVSNANRTRSEAQWQLSLRQQTSDLRTKINVKFDDLVSDVNFKADRMLDDSAMLSNPEKLLTEFDTEIAKGMIQISQEMKTHVAEIRERVQQMTGIETYASVRDVSGASLSRPKIQAYRKGPLEKVGPWMRGGWLYATVGTGLAAKALFLFGAFNPIFGLAVAAAIQAGTVRLSVQNALIQSKQTDRAEIGPEVKKYVSDSIRAARSQVVEALTNFDRAILEDFIDQLRLEADSIKQSITAIKQSELLDAKAAEAKRAALQVEMTALARLNTDATQNPRSIESLHCHDASRGIQTECLWRGFRRVCGLTMPQNAPTRNEIENLLVKATVDTAPYPKLRPLHTELLAGWKRLREPMRVAVVGFIKAGKSTMLNAILGGPVLPTGRLETTYNVNWLEYADPARLIIQYKDGRPNDEKDFAELPRLTVRPETADAEIDAISRIRVGYPAPMLHSMTLIDTPGFASVYGTDQSNAACALGLSDAGTVETAFLNEHGDVMTRMTVDQIEIADAVLYLFRSAAAAKFYETLKMFLGDAADGATPLNSIGILTQIDDYWKPPMRSSVSGADAGATSPEIGELLRLAASVVSSQKESPTTRRLLHDILPVSALLAESAYVLTEDDVRCLLTVARIGRLTLWENIFDARDFTAADVYPEVPIGSRVRLMTLLGRFGIWSACEYLRFCGQTHDGLRAHLIEESGVPHVCRLLDSHFGTRSRTIKLDSLIRRLTATATGLRAGLDGEAQAAFGRTLIVIQNLRTLSVNAASVGVLENLYSGKLELSDAMLTEIAQVTGETGSPLRNLLGILETASLQDMITCAAAKVAKWRRHEQTYRIGSAEAAQAVLIALTAYERIVLDLKQAGRWIARANLETVPEDDQTVSAEITGLRARARNGREYLLSANSKDGLPERDREQALCLLDPESPGIAIRLGLEIDSDRQDMIRRLRSLRTTWNRYGDFRLNVIPELGSLSEDIVRICEYSSHCLRRVNQILAGEG